VVRGREDEHVAAATAAPIFIDKANYGLGSTVRVEVSKRDSVLRVGRQRIANFEMSTQCSEDPRCSLIFSFNRGSDNYRKRETD
jgi:hypothetical protein